MAAAQSDAVDEIIAQWKRERPELDLRAMAIVGRLARVHAHGSKLVADTLASHGLNIGEFDVLAALRRAGEPHRLAPTSLARGLMLSTAAMTNRLDRLEQAGLVERLPDPDDRRALQIALTRAGLARVDAAVADHVANEARLLSALTRAEQSQLSALLKKLLLSLER